MDYDKDTFDKASIGDEYLPSWEKFGTIRAEMSPTRRTTVPCPTQLANYPEEGDRIIAYCPHSHSAIQAETSGSFSRCHARY